MLYVCQDYEYIQKIYTCDVCTPRVCIYLEYGILTLVKLVVRVEPASHPIGNVIHI